MRKKPSDFIGLSQKQSKQGIRSFIAWMASKLPIKGVVRAKAFNNLLQYGRQWLMVLITRQANFQ